MNHEIFLRCHVTEAEEKEHHQNVRETRWPEYVLVFDTETTTDERQALNFGVYQVCRADDAGAYRCEEEGFFYADDLSDSQQDVLKQYVTRKGSEQQLKIYSRSKFMEQVFHVAVQSNAAIVAFNLPFDLSRLAVEYRIARIAGGRAWSLILFRYYDRKKRRWLPNSFRPRIQLRPKDSKAAFIRLAGGDADQPFRSGRFLDVKTLVWALRNTSLSLQSACNGLNIPGKMDHKPTGKVTQKEIDYCRQDVRATVNLLNALRAEFIRYPVDLAPEKAYSAASIAKDCLRTMGLIPPAQKFQLDQKTLGICMQAYYGGRAEVRIRHTQVPVVYADFTSQYPSVNALLGLWPMLTANKLSIRDSTQEVRKFFASLTLERLLDPKAWPDLAFFAQVQPENDILPVRTVYSADQMGDDTNIGLNPLTSQKPLWFAGPDIVASFLLTGKVPKILRAIRFEAEGKQKGMKPVALGKRAIDPYKDNFFRSVIEQRKRLSSDDPLYYFLKILANAGCYGIYAEINRSQTGKNSPKKISVFSGEDSFPQSACTVETPGPWYFPPVAALTTAGGRLLLALLERMVTDAGGTYLMCDTDSMAIVASENGGLVTCNGGPHRLPDGRQAIKALSWKEVRRIVDRFSAINPYDRKIIPNSILQIVEDVNLGSSGRQRQVYGYGISAKRYALFTCNKSQMRLVKPSEHGLGLYYRPKEGRCAECDVALWIKEGWEWILNRALGLRFREPDWFRLPVMRRIAISTPHVMAALRRLDAERARPYNFALSPVLVNLTGQACTLLAPFEKNAARWQKMSYINIHDGSTHTLKPATLAALAKTFDLVFSHYHKHPESKSLACDGTACKADTTGVLKRYPVTASGFHFIGKETERGWEQAEDISTLLPSLVRYQQNPGAIANSQMQQTLQDIPRRALMRTTGLSQHTIERALRGEKLHPRTRKILLAIARTVLVPKR